MINTIKNAMADKIQKTIDALEQNFSKIRTGRAHPSILDSVSVNAYGSQMQLKQVANIIVEDSRTLSLTVFDKSMIQAIEKAILTSDLGLNPASTGTSIRIPMPALTEETRKSLTKQAKSEAEQSKIAVRNIRRDALSQIKDQVKAKVLSEDDEKKAEADIQKLIDKAVKDIDNLTSKKEKDLMSV